MKLRIKNIGKIKEANIEIDGIAVIAGENNSGKSTISKSLYAMFDGFHNIDNRIKNERQQSLAEMLDRVYQNASDVIFGNVEGADVARLLIDNIVKYRDNAKLTKEEILDQYMSDEFIEDIEKMSDELENIMPEVMEVLNISDDVLFRRVLTRAFTAEFSGQINNVYNEQEGEVELEIKNTKLNVIIKNNIVDKIENRIDLRVEPIYFDNPFIMDEQNYIYRMTDLRAYNDHKSSLRRKIFKADDNASIVNEILAINKLEKIYSKINEVCSGEIIRGRNTVYKERGMEKGLYMKNISSGLKTFAMLKMLLINGTIEKNGTIILDEPEIHLHPQWQLVFAELIVLIQKEFGVHILLNTHSPYFLQAIEVYAAKYEMADKCKYYLSSLVDEQSVIEDVTDNIEKVYSKLAKPFQILENERYSE